METAFGVATYWGLCGIILGCFALMLLRAMIVDKTVNIYEGMGIFAANAVVLLTLLSYFGLVAFGIHCALLAVFVPIFIVRIKKREQRRMEELDSTEVAQAKKRIAEHPTLVAAYERLGDIYLKQKRYDLAIENYDIAVKLTEGKADHVAMKGKLKSAGLAKTCEGNKKKSSASVKFNDIFKKFE